MHQPVDRLQVGKGKQPLTDKHLRLPRRLLMRLQQQIRQHLRLQQQIHPHLRLQHLLALQLPRREQQLRQMLQLPLRKRQHRRQPLKRSLKIAGELTQRDRKGGPINDEPSDALLQR